MKKIILLVVFFTLNTSFAQAISLGMEVPYGFFEVKNENLLKEIRSQLSNDTNLIAVFAPENIKQSIESGNLEQVTRLVYIYEPKNNFSIVKNPNPSRSISQALRKKLLQPAPILGIETAAESYSKIYSRYKKAIPFTPANKDIWEAELQKLAVIGEPILVHQSKNDEATQYNYIVMQSFNTSPNTYIQCLIATSLILDIDKIYYVSASSFVYSSSFYDDMEWIAETMRSFLPNFPIL